MHGKRVCMCVCVRHVHMHVVHVGTRVRPCAPFALTTGLHTSAVIEAEIARELEVPVNEALVAAELG